MSFSFPLTIAAPTPGIAAPIPSRIPISFPLTHNLDDSPYSSRSSSPLESELIAGPIPETATFFPSTQVSSEQPSALTLPLPCKPLTLTPSPCIPSSSCSYSSSSCLSLQTSSRCIPPSSTPAPSSSCSSHTASCSSSSVSSDSSTPSSSESSTPCPSSSLGLPSSSSSATAPSLSPSDRPPSPTTPCPKRQKISFSTSPPRKGDEDYIKRPENAFILFRRSRCGIDMTYPPSGNGSGDKLVKSGGIVKKGKRQAELSKTISEQWKSLSKAEKAHWEEKAKEKKQEHARLYPDYIYRPQRGRKGAEGEVTKKPRKNARKELNFEIKEGSGMNTITFVVAPMSKPIGGGPSPPTTVQVPDVYTSPPSCPGSPSLLERRTAYPGHLEDSFDYHTESPVLDYHIDSPSFMESPALTESQQFIESSGFPLQPSEQFTYAKSMPPTHQVMYPPFTEPSSPHEGPFTPTDLFSQLEPEVYVPPSTHGYVPFNEYGCNEYTSPSNAYVPSALPSGCGFGPLPTQYTSGYGWGSADIWGGTDLVLSADDFDLNAVPTLEMGAPNEYMDYSQFAFDSSMQS